MFHCSSCNYQSNRKFNVKLHINRLHNDEQTTIIQINITQTHTQTTSEGTQTTLENTQTTSESTSITPLNKVQTVSIGTQTSLEDIILSTDKNIEKICEKCWKNFKTAHGFRKHKNICKGVSNILECHFCHHVFACQQSKSKHLKICKIRKMQEHNDNENKQNV